MKTKITKINIKDGCANISYNEIADDGKITKVGKECPYLVTDDFTKALAKFKAHLAMICDLKETTLVGDDFSEFDPEDMGNIKITGIVISGSEENEGVVIVGQKEIGNKVLNLTSPFTRFTDEHEPYAYEHELYEDAVHACYEAELYLFEGKVAVKQLELFGEETEDLD